jgi:predicted AAA+ superfamily ATPase
MPELISRCVTGHAEEFLDAFRVVIVNGPRQSGKTTLLQQLNEGREGTYLTLDDGPLRAAAQADPASFIADESRPS